MSPKIRELSVDGSAEEMRRLMTELYPICRSITGDGVRRTLEIIRQLVPLEVIEVPSGTPVFDWTVPNEWNIRDAYIKDPNGEKVVDFSDHNLHVVGYSVPVRQKLPLDELQEHLHSLPEQPELIPYRTSYYKEIWGFCLSHEQRGSLGAGEYEVVIDSSLESGQLTYGELVLPGESEEEILVSCHICHPSLANDNLSGLAVTAFLARALETAERRFTYRFLFIPGTIGSITWLALNEKTAHRIRAGLVAANLGDPGCFHYKRSRQGDTEIDRAVQVVLRDTGEDHRVEDFVPFGYDERQYCSPGFDLAVGSLTRTPWGRYPEYHTSADNLELVTDDSLQSSLETYLEVVKILEQNRRFRNLNPKCEPQLGKRGLYGSLGGGTEGRDQQLARLWVLNLSDGEHTLLAIAERSRMSFARIAEAAAALLAAELLEVVE
jgi:aminopeptidase-like protein